MIVVITTWLPRRACSQPGMNAQAPPNAAAAEDRERHHEQPGQPAEIEADQGHAEAADIGLALAADVEQAAVEGDRDREAREDEAGGVEQRVADRLAIAEGAEDQELDRLERVLAEEQHDQAGDQERRGEVEQRQQPEVHPGRQLTRARGHQMCFPAFAACSRFSNSVGCRPWEMAASCQATFARRRTKGKPDRPSIASWDP